MNLLELARAAIDPRNLSIGADVGAHVRQVMMDGRITPREVVEAACGAIEHALSEYDAEDAVVLCESPDHAAVRARIEHFLDVVDSALEEALTDRQITYGELNTLGRKVADAVLDVVAPLEEKSE